jgi:hypothetical protein
MFLLDPAGMGMELAGVARGLGLRFLGEDITGEGLGLGGVVLRVGRVTYFPLSSKDSLHEEGFSRVFLLNGVSRRYLGPLDITELHRFVRDRLAPHYQSGSPLAPLFHHLMRLRGLLLRTRYVAVDTRETAQATFTCRADEIRIRVRRERGCGKMIVANELSGRFFDYAVIGGRRVALPPWMRSPERRPTLGSSLLKLELSLEVPPEVEAFIGREVQPPRLDWAGIDLVMEEGVKEISYRVLLSLAS